MIAVGPVPSVCSVGIRLRVTGNLRQGNAPTHILCFYTVFRCFQNFVCFFTSFLDIHINGEYKFGSRKAVNRYYIKFVSKIPLFLCKLLAGYKIPYKGAAAGRIARFNLCGLRLHNPGWQNDLPASGIR